MGDEREASGGRFRVRALRLFLTWPKVSQDAPDLGAWSGFLRGVLSEDLSGGIVAREQHKDGDWHIHAFLEFRDRVTINDPRIYDYNGHHANIQSARSSAAVRKYITKDGDYESWGDIILPDLQRTEMGRAIISDPRRLAELVGRSPGYVLQYDRLERAVDSYYAAVAPRELRDVRGIWIYGPSGSGKSWDVYHKHPDAYRHMVNTKWYDHYRGEKTLVFDDFRAQAFAYHDLLRILDPYPLFQERKGSVIYAQWTLVIFTSIDHPRSVYPNSWDSQLERRLTILHFPDDKNTFTTL